MKYLSSCMQCLIKKNHPISIKTELIEGRNLEEKLGIKINNKDILDHLFLIGHCPDGHFNFQVLQAYKFEAYFAMALEEYLIENYNTALLYFGIAKERFYHFFLDSVMHDRLPEKNAVEKLDKYSQQLEGAFRLAYNIYFGEDVQMFDTNTQNIRNELTHKGVLTTKENCKKYAEDLFKFIKKIVEKLNEKDKGFYGKELKRRLEKLKCLDDAIAGMEITVSVGTSFAAFLVKDNIEENFEELVKKYFSLNTEKYDIDGMNQEIQRFLGGKREEYGNQT